MDILAFQTPSYILDWGIPDHRLSSTVLDRSKLDAATQL